MQRKLFFLLAAAFTMPASPSDVATAAAPDIETSDVHRFYELYDRSNGRPSAAQLQHEYIDGGSEGLRDFARLRRITGSAIAETLEARPSLYANARQCADALPRVRERLGEALAELGRLYPDARRPTVTVAVGRGRPVAIGYPDTGVQVGLEALCATDYLNPDIEDRFVYVIAHEYVHVQQTALAYDSEPTVLQLALVEGAAEFVGELISGGAAYENFRASTAGREAEIETAFLEDLDKTDLSDWFYDGTPEEPGDLGYWVGYRIVKSYFQCADDETGALRDILEMTEPEAFLAKSCWRPGIELNQR